MNFPTAYSSITVHQFHKYKTAHDDIDRVIAITGAEYEEVRALQSKELPKIIELFEQLLNNEVATDVKRFDVANKTFGLIPNFNRLTFGEWEDLQAYTEDFYTNLPKIVSLLFRPVTERIGDKYLIEDYSPKRAELHRDLLTHHLTMDILNSAMLFFSSIETELSQCFLRHSESVMKTAIREVVAEMS